ncbi:MAG: aminoacyl-tRNA hydrolase [Cyclobacteriaceae bacterium]
MKYLIIGLGNIGSEYEDTRHNIGFMALDYLINEKGAQFTLEKLAFKGEIKHKGRTIHLIKPTTYMNLSGKAVNYWMKQLNIPKENILVLVDDIALPFAKIRLRTKGSSAGHNGLKNIEEMTGGQNYTRLKIGIGDDFPKGQQVKYVLGKFNKEETDDMPQLLDKVGKTVLSFCTIGASRTMNEFND